MGCRWVIIGHSERRSRLGETDEAVRAKVERAAENGLAPIACVGETLEQREAGEAERAVGRQVEALLASGGASALAEGAVAYEPVWAIGTGRTASPEDAQAMHRAIRRRIADRSPPAAASLRILYGGSGQREERGRPVRDAGHRRRVDRRGFPRSRPVHRDLPGGGEADGRGRGRGDVIGTKQGPRC